jgi:hypothetical protein
MTLLYESQVPTHGVDFAPDEPLPAPQHPDAVVTVNHPDVEEEHQVQIFSSAHPRLGGSVKTYAQELHTQVYLEHKYIGNDDLNELGIFVDQYSNRSTYLYVKNGNKVAAARYIHADKKEGGVLSLPTTEHFDVDPLALRSVADVRRLADIKPNEIVEISGLVARKQQGGPEGALDATIALYARMLRDSLELGHKVWVLNVEKSFLRYLNGMVGRDQVHVLGPQKEYMGPATLPVAINPQEVVRSTLSATGFGSDMKRAYLKEVLTGIDDRKVPADIRGLLKKHEIPTAEYPIAKRILTDPKAIAYSAIMAYSAARALPASTVGEFHGNSAMLWGVDVATALPYTWGVIEAFTGKSLPRRALGSAVGAASFVAPYAYFEATGNNYPPYVNAIVGGFVGAAVAKEVVIQVMKGRKERGICENLKSSDLPDLGHAALVGTVATETEEGSAVTKALRTTRPAPRLA